MKRYDCVTISTCKNGWMVQQADGRGGGLPSGWLVFQTFEALSKWLKEAMKLPPED